MKARLPQGHNSGGGVANMQQLALQAQKMQERMTEVEEELDTKEYSATSGGDAVKATVTGKMEVVSLDIKPEIVDPNDVEMLGDIITAAVNAALTMAAEEKEERMSELSGGLNIPGM